MDMKIDEDGKFWSTLIVEKTREYCNVIDIFALYINVIENRIRESKKKRNREKKKIVRKILVLPREEFFT